MDCLHRAVIAVLLVGAAAGGAQADGNTPFIEGLGVCPRIRATSTFAAWTRNATDQFCELSAGTKVPPFACIGDPANDMFCSTVEPDGKTFDFGGATKLILPIKATTPTTCSAGNEGALEIDDDNTPAGLSYQDIVACIDGSITKAVRMVVDETHTFCIQNPTTSSDIRMIASGIGRPFKLVRVCVEINAGSATTMFERRDPADAAGAGADMQSAVTTAVTNADLDGTSGCTTAFTGENLIANDDKIEFDVRTTSGVSQLCVTYQTVY